MRGLLSLVRRLADYLSPTMRLRRRLLVQMRQAGSYSDWLALAQRLLALDRARGGGRGHRELEGRLFDRHVLEARTRQLRLARERGDTAELMFLTRSELVRNFANMASPEVHEALPLMPHEMSAYVAEVNACLAFVMDSPISPK